MKFKYCIGVWVDYRIPFSYKYFQCLQHATFIQKIEMHLSTVKIRTIQQKLNTHKNKRSNIGTCHMGSSILVSTLHGMKIIPNFYQCAKNLWKQEVPWKQMHSSKWVRPSSWINRLFSHKVRCKNDPNNSIDIIHRRTPKKCMLICWESWRLFCMLQISIAPIQSALHLSNRVNHLMKAQKLSTAKAEF